MITDIELDKFRQHVLSQYPNEACGVLVKGIFIPCTNIAEKPTDHFQIAASELAMLGASFGKIDAILHSHPYKSNNPPRNEPSWPSHHDMVQWLKNDIPWGIVATEGENISPIRWLDESVIAPLEGREFVHGIHDCYATVRDWFRVERGITIPNYARGMEWWDKGMNLYEENFADAGFVEVSRKDIDVGDVILMKVRSPVPNHAAVITGSNEILHHLFHRYSGKDRFDRWERFVTKYLRYKGTSQ